MSKLSKSNQKFINHLLIGAPNVGKSTFFNLLTSSTAVVSNIDRMTTEHTSGKIKKIEFTNLIDLPGLHNLSHPLAEEQEASFHLFKAKTDGIVNIISAYSIQRDLYLTLQCIETGLLNTLVINMIDQVNQCEIDWLKFSKMLNGTNVILTQTNKSIGIAEAIESIKENKHVDCKVVTYSKHIENLIEKLSKILPDDLQVSKRFASLMVLENNEFFIDILKNDYSNVYNEVIKIIDFGKSVDYINEIRQTKFIFINKLMNEANFTKVNYTKVSIEKQSKFDRWILNKWVGIPFFILVILIVYYISFGAYAGGWIQTNFAYFLNEIVAKQGIGGLFDLMGAANSDVGLWFKSLFVDGIFGGVFAVLSFLPTIIILYTLITIMQQVGLISRVSVLLDNAFAKFGLSGRSVVNLLTGFGCNVPAVMLARSSSSKKERIVSILIIPFVACASRVIVINFIATYCLGSIGLTFGWLITLLFVFLSGLIALMMGLIFSNVMFRNQKSFFLVELVKWNTVDVRVVAKTVWLQIKEFLKKAFLIILIATIVLWFLMHLGTNGLIVDSSSYQTSFLYYISYGLSFIFYPIFGQINWQLTTCLVTGFAAKEAVISTIILMTGSLDNASLMFQGAYAIAMALSFLTFFLFYMPCLATMRVVKTEGGWKTLWINLISSFTTGYVLALMVYWSSVGITNLVM